jgi:hypothetical protein
LNLIPVFHTVGSDYSPGSENVPGISKAMTSLLDLDVAEDSDLRELISQKVAVIFTEAFRLI